jgi:hypothetical protein
MRRRDGPGILRVFQATATAQCDADAVEVHLATARGEVPVKRPIAAGLAILAVASGVGWKLASHPETSAGLQEISLKRHSEHSHPGPTDALARIRIRLSPDDLGFEARATAHQVPQIPLAAE